MTSLLEQLSVGTKEAIKEKLSIMKDEFNKIFNERKFNIGDEKEKLSTKLSSKSSETDDYGLSSSIQHKILSTEISTEKESNKILSQCLPFQPGFAKLNSIPTKISKRQVKKQRKIEREMTKGKGWFNIPATEQTEETVNDLRIIQMRGVLDPKRFYKNHDSRECLPKYFQEGQIVETKADFYSSRIPKKKRKKTFVEELLQDVEFKKFNKRKLSTLSKISLTKKNKVK